MKRGTSGAVWAAGFVVLLFGAGFFISSRYAEAFSIRAAFRNDPQFFSVLFDGTIASSTATSSRVTISATTTVTSVNASADILSMLFGTASGTVSIGDPVTVSSSITDTGNATNTSIVAQTLLPAVKIAAVRAGGTSDLDEYILLYNQMGQAWTASGTLFLHTMRGGVDTPLPLSFATTTVPNNGFFLITPSTGFTGGFSADATYSTSSNALPATSTAVYINTTSTAWVNIIDKVEWGSSAQLTTSTNATTTFANTVAIAALGNNNTLIRKATAGSTSSTVAMGGAESNKGASYDTRSNSNDFVTVSSTQAIIKNSASPKEFPFSGGQQDTTVPTVGGSFPSGVSGEMVPTDLRTINFGFTKPVNPTTLTSSTVSLVVQGQSTNLCASVSYSNTGSFGPPGQCTLSTTLTAGTTYVFTIKGSSSTPNVSDFGGLVLNQPAGSNPGQFGNANHDFQISFTPTSGFASTPSVPPSVLGTYPAPGNAGVPSNISAISASFSQAMSSSSFSGVTLIAASGGSNLLNNASATLSADGKSGTIPLSGSLTAGTPYIITIPVSVRNSNNVPLAAPFVAQFTVGSGGDTTGPQVLGKLPNITTGVPVNATDIHVSTDDSLDPSTITSSSVKVTDAASNVIPGTVTYNPLAREVVWTGSGVFQPSTAYTVTLNASGTAPSVKNAAGLALQDTDGSANAKYQFSFTTGAADATGPGILFANANGFSLAVTFDEAVKETEVKTLDNYALTNGTSSVALSALNGQTVSYDGSTRTATINGITLTPGHTFIVTVANVHDLSNNVIDPTKTSFSGTVQASTANGGGVGMGGGFIKPPDMNIPTGFSSSTFSFMPQPSVRPFNTLAGFTSTYGIDVPLTKQIASTTGKIILAFPSSFTLANAAADSFSPANSDINGPGTGAVTIGSVAANDTAHTITVTLGAVPTRGGAETFDFLHFDLSGIQNSSQPNTAEGYTVDIRTVNGTTTLESMTSKPFFVTGGGDNVGTLTVSVAAAGATAGTSTIYLFSPQTGPLSTSTTAFVSGNATGTFASLPNGMYNLMTDPIITLTGGTFLGQSMPTPVNVSGTTAKALTFSAQGAASASSTVRINASAAGKKISVFAGGPQGFVDVATSTINGTTSVVIFYPGNGDYMVGVGPQINKTFMGPPPAPDYVMPQPVRVTVNGGIASQQTIDFRLASASFSIAGTVKDASSKVVANANIFAYSPQGGFGTFGTSGSDGSFSLNVGAGSYKVGASAPGFPTGQEIPVKIDSLGYMYVSGASASSSSVTLKLSKPSTSISGTVYDSSSNPVQGAQVWAYCDFNTSNNSCFGPNGHAESQAGSDGTYTLYVGNGTWKVGAFIPGFGKQPEISVTISGSDASSKNFQPSATGTFRSVSGTVCTGNNADCTGGTGIANANVRIEGNDADGNYYSNSVITGSDGTYTFSSIPAGAAASYRIRGFSPALGEMPTTAAFGVNAANVSGKDLVVKAGRTVTVSLVNAPSAFNIFMRFGNTTSGISNFLNFQNNATGTVSLPGGAIYSVDTRSPGFSFVASDIALTAGTGTYSTSTGQLDLTSGSNAISLSLTFPTSTPITGTARDGDSAAVADAWIDVVNPTSGAHFGTQANSSGTYSMALQSGTYTITAYSPGYLPNPKSLTISATSTVTLGTTVTATSSVNMTLTRATLAITGTITASGSAASGAFVKGSLSGGGTTVTVAGADGTYSLPVSAGTWTISAVVDGYAAGSYSSNVVITNASSSGVNINLDTTRTVAAPVAEPITPSQGGTLRNSSGTLEVSIPANALGSSANSGQVKATEATSLVQTSTARPIGKGQDIKAYDSSNNAITTLNDNVTVSLDIASSTFSSESITSTSTAAKLKLAYFDTSLGDWVPLSTTLTYEDGNGAPVTPTATLSNVDHIALSAPTDHFSIFGAISPTESVAPAAPSGVSAAVTNRTIVVSWTAPTTSSDGSSLTDLMEFEIYRDTSSSGNFLTQVNSSQVASGTLSFTDTSAAVGTTYYYKVTAADTSGNESSKSSATGAVTIPESGGNVGSGGGTTVGGGGGGGGGYTPPATPATTPTTPTTPPATTPQLRAPAAIPAIPSAMAGGIPLGMRSASPAAVPSRILAPGSKNDDVTRLQSLLAKDASLYPEGTVSGYYGTLTKKAVERFQKKYGIVSEGTPETTGFGKVGPKTLAKLNEVFGGAAQAAAAAPSTAAPAPLFTRTLASGSRSSEVRTLQEMLARDSSVYPEGTVSGYYGTLTKKAVERFQEKHGIAAEGEAGYGVVGPKTRAKLNELRGATPATPAVPGVSPAIPAAPANAAAMQTQIQLLQAKVQELLNKLKAGQ
ncbi:MAG: carboxypeptidase regulatory-like domain-containing protein [Candidatus Liptonbacteria bacterium]|nr:carboxypeptidase regulatory-like domain-containing protein [Candidatus Liptonbacteria bacterium]